MPNLDEQALAEAEAKLRRRGVPGNGREADLPMGTRNAIGQARARIRANMPGVLGAERAVLPEPPAIETPGSEDALTHAQ